MTIALHGSGADKDPVEGLGITSMVVFALGSPVIDAVHGNIGLALGSLGIRAFSSLLLMIGVVELSCEESPCREAYPKLVGSALIAIGAIALDGVLDRGPVPSSRDASLPIGLALSPDGALLAWRGTL
jgi:hypothetical protein